MKPSEAYGKCLSCSSDWTMGWFGSAAHPPQNRFRVRRRQRRTDRAQHLCNAKRLELVRIIWRNRPADDEHIASTVRDTPTASTSS